MTGDYLGLFTYWVVIALMMAGLYVVIAQENLIKKVVGLNIFQVSVFLKTSDFRTITRNQQLPTPTQLSEDIYATGRALLDKAADGRAFRLIGIGVVKLVPASEADQPDLADPGKARRSRMEAAMDVLRDRYGTDAIKKGRGFKKPPGAP